MREEVIRKIEQYKVIAIMRGVATDKAVLAAKALYEGGVRLVEVTFNQKAPETFKDTMSAISAIKAEMGDKMTVGAGTVITVEQAEMAKSAGAEYIVSPDTDEEVIKRTIELDMVSLPGAYTATECKKAHNAGADFVKLFPCTDGADKYLKALRAPLSHIKFLAVGGVTPENAPDFMKAGAYGIGVGSAIVNGKWVDDGEFGRITEQARLFADAVKQ
ncbi:MAG: bifunctional 4-hydroxy-2-oxoglutarate aldolase/2-dehydro-3-deoxy-phosphogluconate aldolase [Ruminococcaceae bacterium]|nr:bifunctional 4-hydroxy-2-oxoglutarate aldolase/2-dehydro-3-deoxy-phosphogluconate aldolase [Oscillospiraceae bacterium]